VDIVFRLERPSILSVCSKHAKYFCPVTSCPPPALCKFAITYKNISVKESKNGGTNWDIVKNRGTNWDIVKNRDTNWDIVKNRGINADIILKKCFFVSFYMKMRAFWDIAMCSLVEMH
jgi:hypothetical protein